MNTPRMPGWLMLLPVVALCAFMVAAPIVNLFIQSLAPAPPQEGLTVAHYTRFFTGAGMNRFGGGFIPKASNAARLSVGGSVRR